MAHHDAPSPNLSISSQPGIEETPVASISGSLYKKTRDGRWQRRWFQTNGFYLIYYKSKKMEKVLAALYLPQVGEISLVTEPGEQSEALFSMELDNRIYTLRGKDKEEAQRWVDILRKLRDQGAEATSRYSAQVGEGRMQSFNIDNSLSTTNSSMTPETATVGKAKLLNNESNATWVKSSKLWCTWCCCFK